MKHKEYIRSIINDNSTKSGRTFALSIQFLILISLLSFSISTIPDLSPAVVRILYKIEVATITCFSIEYILRVYVAKKKLKFIFSFFGLIDLISILPFYLRTTIDLRSLRLLRMLRIFRILKLVRYNKAIMRFHRMLILAKEELILFSFLSLLLLYLASVGIYFCENEVQPEVFKSVFHCMWWGVTTLTTVGYGDMYPVTTGGKIFTFFILIIGLGIIAVPTGIVSSALNQAMDDEKKGNNDND